MRIGAAAALALGLALAPLAGTVPIVVAAGPSVTLVTNATYDVLPAEHRVAVTVDIAVTSHLHDTVTKRYYADRAYLAVMPGASKFRLSAAGGTPSVAVTSRSAAATVLALRFGSQLGAGKSLAMTLTFDIVDPGGTPDRALRISPSLVAFQAWAFGSDGIAGSTVRVRLPAGYGVSVGRGPLAGPTTEPDGHLAYASAALASPATFVADILADRPGDLLDTSRSIVVGGTPVTLLSRSWPDDPAWRAKIEALLVPGLPALADMIGMPWPLAAQLEVLETLPRPSGGAGSFGGAGEAAALDPAASRLDVAYLANATAILHGAAHSWFNGNLVADAWIADGFGALYAERAGTVIGVPVTSPVMTEAALALAEPLNAWVPGGPADAFEQAASRQVARAIVGQAGDDAMRAVWADVARGVGAYPAVGTGAGGSGTGTGNGAGEAPEPTAGPADWRSLLDLLEAHTSTSFDALWRRWIVRPADATLLDARAAARREYGDVVAAAGDWTLPASIREELGAWQFQAATEELDAAASVLRQRQQIAEEAAAAGLTQPSSLKDAFEGTEGLAAASAEAVTELAVIATYDRAAATRPPSPDLLTRIGLLGTTPDVDLATAAAAFAAGDLDGTLRLSAAARTTWLATPDVARGRILSVAGLSVAVVLLAYLIASRRRAHRRRRGWGRS